MPAILKKAYKNRNKIPEFLGYMQISRYLNIPTPKLKASGIFADIPFRYDEGGKRIFKYTAVMDAIAKYRVSPPDTMHPLHEFTQAEALVELGMKPEIYSRYRKEGKIRVHRSERTGHLAVYRKDINRFYREWWPEYLVANMVIPPVKRTMAALLLGIGIPHLKRMTHDGKISYEPRQRRQPYKYSKSEMLRYMQARKNRWYRRNPLPEFLQPCLAAAYMGITEERLVNLRVIGVVKYAENPVGTGACKWCYRRSELDDAIDRINGQIYYCDGMEYYTRRAIKYKFLKNDLWVDEYIAGKCRRVMSAGKIIPPTGETKGPPCGWLKEDVERIVASGVEVKIRKKAPSSMKRKYRKISKAATPPVVFSNPVEQMEAAISAAMRMEKENRVKKRSDAMRKVQAESERLQAIRNILTGGPATRQSRPSRNDMLRFATERPIVTLLFSSTGYRGKYDEYPNAKDECIFRVSCRKSFGRRQIPPSFARAISNALKIYNKNDAALTPSWVIIVSATSLIPDPMFHKYLDEVPTNVGAVAPFGYGHMLPDGSWDRCPDSYGSYGLYSELTKEHRKVDGIVANTGSHPVQVMDGPFVALRGEYMSELQYINYFQQLGDQRGLLGPVVSAICMKFGIPMMQIPVESWGSMEYIVRPGTPEMNLAIERIATFVERPLDDLKG